MLILLLATLKWVHAISRTGCSLVGALAKVRGAKSSDCNVKLFYAILKVKFCEDNQAKQFTTNDLFKLITR
jgi:hypothetical protein